MSEAELHILKQRMQQGRLSKARRGELALPLPTGYSRRASGEVTFDPDEQVQHVVRLILRKFEELGTLNAVLHYLVRHQIQVGIRARTGLAKGDLEWHRPTRMTLQNLLKNPLYAGAYAYGRRQVDRRKQHPGRPSTGRVVIEPAAWFVLLKVRFPAYTPGSSTSATWRGSRPIKPVRTKSGRHAMGHHSWPVSSSVPSAAVA